MEVRDYNNSKQFSLSLIKERYRDLAESLNSKATVAPSPYRSSDGKVEWIYLIWFEIAKLLKHNDGPSIELAIQCIESTDPIPFGRTIRCQLARGLKICALSESHKERLRTRILQKLESGRLGAEFRDYIKLLRKIGIGRHSIPNISTDDPFYLWKAKNTIRSIET